MKKDTVADSSVDNANEWVQQIDCTGFHYQYKNAKTAYKFYTYSSGFNLKFDKNMCSFNRMLISRMDS